MARISTQSLIQAFEALNKELNKTLASYDTILKGLVKSSKQITVNLESIEVNSAKGVQELNKALVEAEKISTQRQKTDTERQRTLQQLKKVEQEYEKVLQQQERTQQQQIKTQEAEARQKKRLQAETAKQTRVQQQLNSAYKQLTTQTNAAQARLKELAARFGENSKQARQAQREFEKLDKRLRAINDLAKDGRRDVGRYGTAWGRAGNTVRNVLGGLGVVGGVQLLGNALRDGVTTIREFEQQLSRVQAVSGASSAQFERLRNDSLRLGSTTSKTATEVGQLQEEFAKLGFTTDEIVNATEATLNLSIATQSDLATAAEVAGSTLRGFGLDASETSRVTDVMAKSFTTSALDLESFRESMKFVAPVAKAAGVSIEETTALLGTLADAGIKGSNAGTALRRILGDMSKEGKTAAEAIKDLSKEGLTLEDAFDEVGRTAQTSLLVLAENIEKTDSLTSSFNNASGAAKSMADTVQDTLSGDIDKLSSAFEGLILSLGDSGLLKVIRSTIQGFTSLLSAISGVNEETKLTITQSVDLLDKNKKTLDRNKDLVSSYEELSSKVNLTSEEKEQLNTVTSNLIDVYGDSIVEINNETGALILNIEALKEKIVTEQVLQTEEAKSILLRQRKAEQLLKEIEAAEKYLETFSQNDLFVKGIFEAAKQGSFELQAFLAQNQIDQTKYAQVIEKANFLINNSFGAIASLDLGNANAELESLGLNLDELVKSYNKTVSKTGQVTTVTEELTGAIELQEAEVSRLREEKRKASEENIAAKTVELDLAEKELKRLQDLGKVQKEVIDDRERIAAGELEDFRLQQEIDIEQDPEKKKDLEEKLIKQKRDRELENEKLTESEKLLIKEKANQELIDLDKEVTEEEIKNDEEVARLRDEAIERSGDLARQIVDSVFEQQKAANQAQIDSAEQSIDLLREAASQGSIQAQQSIAEEQRRIEQLRKEQLEIEERQAKLQAFIAGATVLAATGGDVAAATSGLLAINTATKNLPSFFLGTDDTGQGGNLDSNGGFEARLHRREMVFSEKNVKEMSGNGKRKTRREAIDLIKLGERVQKGELLESYSVNTSASPEMLSEMKEFNKNIRELPKRMPVVKHGLTDNANYIERVIEKEGLKERLRKKAKGSFDR